MFGFGQVTYANAPAPTVAPAVVDVSFGVAVVHAAAARASAAAVASRATRDRDRFEGDAKRPAVMPMPRSLATGKLSVFRTLWLPAVRMPPFGRFGGNPVGFPGPPLVVYPQFSGRERGKAGTAGSSRKEPECAQSRTRLSSVVERWIWSPRVARSVGAASLGIAE